MRAFEWLLSNEGREILTSILPYDEKSALAVASDLRKRGLESDKVSALLTQARIRTKAEAKFGSHAHTFFFTPAGYEQSTRLSVAHAHASMFAHHGATSIIDLGCGIGADTFAFDQAGLRVTAVELDPETAAFAQANVPQAQVINADGRLADLPQADAIWLDPARRTPSGSRIIDPSQWSPSFGHALELASQYRYAGIKVAPGIAHELLPPDAHVVWTSEHGELLEAVVWLGVGSPGRFAVVDGLKYDAGVSQANEPVRYVDPKEPSRLILEPDSALIRAGAIETIAEKYGVAPISSGIAYLSGDTAVPGCSTFEVLDICANNPKEIRRILHTHGIGAVEIKKRGTNTEPEVLRKKLGKREGIPGVVLLSPVMGKHRAIIARRVR